MITIENTSVMGWEPAIRGMRNPLNSWEKSDTLFDIDCDYEGDCIPYGRTINHNIICGLEDAHGENGDMTIGPNDRDLMLRLAKAGTEHAKYRRMITVYADITAPLYWWKEFDTYKVGTVANSCSTMHKIHAKEFTLEDFSCEHLMRFPNGYAGPTVDVETGKIEVGDVPIQLLGDGSDSSMLLSPKGTLEATIKMLNLCRDKFLETKDKRYWWQMIQLLPTSYNQKRTVMLNYENLSAIYRQRKDHKLDEWHMFCDWIKELPYSELITL